MATISKDDYEEINFPFGIAIRTSELPDELELKGKKKAKSGKRKGSDSEADEEEQDKKKQKSSKLPTPPPIPKVSEMHSTWIGPKNLQGPPADSRPPEKVTS
jgi:hypothetical protein